MGSSEGLEVKAERTKVNGKCLMIKCLGKLGLSLALLLLLTVSATPARAQTFAEWFEQGSTLIKYLRKQIAYLKLYDQEVMAGYREAKADLGLINHFKDGELGLHSGYYASLKQVRPEVRASADLDSLQPEVRLIEQQFSGLSSLSGLTRYEQSYVESVRKNVLALCNKDLDALGLVLGSGELAMKDDERIVRVREIAASVKETYLFACHFCNEVRLLSAQRIKDGQEASGLDQLYGIGQ